MLLGKSAASWTRSRVLGQAAPLVTLYWGYMGITDKKIEATITIVGNIGFRV